MCWILLTADTACLRVDAVPAATALLWRRTGKTQAQLDTAHHGAAHGRVRWWCWPGVAALTRHPVLGLRGGSGRSRAGQTLVGTWLCSGTGLCSPGHCHCRRLPELLFLTTRDACVHEQGISWVGHERYGLQMPAAASTPGDTRSTAASLGSLKSEVGQVQVA